MTRRLLLAAAALAAVVGLAARAACHDSGCPCSCDLGGDW